MLLFSIAEFLIQKYSTENSKSSIFSLLRVVKPHIVPNNTPMTRSDDCNSKLKLIDKK